MKKEVCPAWGKTCNTCHKENHFKGSQSCHKTKKVYAIGDAEDSESTDEEIIMSLNHVESVRAVTSKAVYCEMQMQRTPVKLQNDCGATVNIMPHHLVPVPYKLNACNITLKMWNKTTMDALGQRALKLKNRVTGKKYNVLFVIVAEDLTPLLSRTAAEKMGLITINYGDFKRVNAVCEQNNSPEVEFGDVFTGEVGKLPGTAHLTLQAERDPVVCPMRGIPIAIRDKVHDKIF